MLDLRPPTADEIAAVIVAHDLRELGRDDEARATLARAPNRLYWPCPICAARRGEPCTDATDEDPRVVPHLVRVDRAS